MTGLESAVLKVEAQYREELKKPLPKWKREGTRYEG